VLPFDYDDLCVERIDPGRSFLERSTMLSCPQVGTRGEVLQPLEDCVTELTDRVSFVPRLPRAARAHRGRYRPRSSDTAIGAWERFFSTDRR